MVNSSKRLVTTNDAFNMIERLYDIDNLYKSFRKVEKVSGWKAQTQKYDENLILNLVNLQDKLIKGEYRFSKPNLFLLNERGKTRLIESYSIEDRIVQGCLVEEILLPLCRPKLIYDNSASLKRRGTNHFRKRLEMHLKDYYQENGNEGYILLCDFKKFFDNIWHDTFLQTLIDFGIDDETLDFVKQLMKTHEVDVSYMPEEGYKNCMNEPFDAISYYRNISKEQKTGEKFMRKSMGIGSQIAQLGGVISPYKLDNYIKIVCGLKYYGRYMDDFYIIHKDKEYLRKLMANIEHICCELGLILNPEKTQVVKLSRRFTLLQTQYILADDGEIIKIPKKRTFKVERRKLKCFGTRYRLNKMTLTNIENQYKSWRGGIVKRFGEIQSIKSTDNYLTKCLKE